MRKMSRHEARDLAATTATATQAAEAGMDSLNARLHRALDESQSALDDARRKRVQTLLDAAEKFDQQAYVPEGKKERLGHRRAAKQAEEYRAKALALLDEWGIEA